MSDVDKKELEWSETLLGGERVNYKAAEAAVAALGDGWRLPTRTELLTLVDDTKFEPAIDTERFPDTKSTWYWTGTPCAWNTSARWVVYFDAGDVNGNHQHLYACVRAVRASQ